MSRDDRIRLQDALSHVEHALEHWSSIEPDGLEANRLARQSLLYDVIVIGTAFAAIPQAIRNLAPDIAWKPVIRTRNRFVHVYWNDDIVFMISLVTIELPLLRDQLIDLIEMLGRGNP